MTAHRFTALDGMRGICALMVLLYHTFRLAPRYRFEHGYLSVDVFFLLSGFVLSFAFASKFASGMPLDIFLRARFVRLWPVLILGAVLGGVGLSVTEYMCDLPHSNVIAIFVNIVESIFLIPRVAGAGLAFPLNGNLWSLFAEFWVNVVFALFIVRLNKRALLAIMFAGWVFFGFEAFVAGTVDVGPLASTAFMSIPRAIPSFTCGVWLYRLWQDGTLQRLPSVHPIIVFGLWIGVTLVPTAHSGIVFDLLQIIVTAPLLIALLARWTGPAPALAAWLGRISYPLYATQGIFVVGVQRFATMHGSMSLGAEIMLIVLSLAAAEIAARWYEPRVMTAWRNALLPARPREPGPDEPAGLPGSALYARQAEKLKEHVGL